MNRRWPSIEKILVAYLPTITGGVHATVELPHDFQNPDGPTHMLPVIALDRISGAELDPRLDRPIVDIDVYAATRAQAQDIAEMIRTDFRHNLRGKVIEDAVFTRARTVVAPRELPHANPRIRRYSANYELLLHPL